MKCNVIIAMAGISKRFTDAGYQLPKFLLKMPSSKSMISEVLKDFIDPNVEVHLQIVVKNIYVNYLSQLIQFEYPDKFASANIIGIDQTTQGPLVTSILGAHLITNDFPIIIGDCDHLIRDKDWLSNSLNIFKSSDGGLYNFLAPAEDTKWSFANIKNGKVLEVREKERISDWANTGRYYFKNKPLLIKAANHTFENNIKVNNEFYIAPIYNFIIANQGEVLSFNTRKFIPLGTPQNYENCSLL